ncbi:hypothetical protein B0T24DRAFT_621072 [Lasiosphaeria ovina]|uniref:Uncharacterized protein n=1 Tax=Lasiosphaeria ovina TaxID=92902 RepID=A0AAE0KJH3_9PEZI|nr:hypothetical protein B0T24DRAFT_621072 [Lasiosphaeria ovina]
MIPYLALRSTLAFITAYTSRSATSPPQLLHWSVCAIRCLLYHASVINPLRPEGLSWLPWNAATAGGNRKACSPGQPVLSGYYLARYWIITNVPH